MARNIVRLDWKQAALSTPFGRDWAVNLFGEEAVASLPTSGADVAGTQAAGRMACSFGWRNTSNATFGSGRIVGRFSRTLSSPEAIKAATRSSAIRFMARVGTRRLSTTRFDIWAMPQ